MSKRNPAHTTLYLLLSIGYLVGCTGTKHHQEEHEEAASATQLALNDSQQQAAGVQLKGFVYQPIPKIIYSNGLIDLPPNNRAAISAPAQGFVKQVHYIVGDYVKKGSLLLELQNPLYLADQQTYLEAVQHLKLVEKNRNRQMKLFDNQVISAKSWEQFQTEFILAKTRAESLKQRLELLGFSSQKLLAGAVQKSLYLYAPFSGSVSKLHIHKGEWVETGAPLMELIDNDHMHLELNIFQKDIPYVSKDMRVTFRVPAFSDDSTYEGTVALIAQSVSSETKTVLVHAHFEPNALHLPGLYVEAMLWQERPSSRVLPNAAILGYATEADQERPYFFVALDNHLFEAIYFTPGMSNEAYTEVLAYPSGIDSTRIVWEGAAVLGAALKHQNNSGGGGHHH